MMKYLFSTDFVEKKWYFKTKTKIKIDFLVALEIFSDTGSKILGPISEDRASVDLQLIMGT
jgi:hypothetical protein